MKSLDYEKKKKIKNIKTVIYGRTLIVLLAVAVQFVLLFSSLVWLRDYSGLFFAVFTVISAAVVLHLFNAQGAPDVKLTWMLPIAVFPVFGKLRKFGIPLFIKLKYLFKIPGRGNPVFYIPEIIRHPAQYNIRISPFGRRKSEFFQKRYI